MTDPTPPHPAPPFDRGGVLLPAADRLSLAVDECLMSKRGDRWVCNRADIAHVVTDRHAGSSEQMAAIDGRTREFIDTYRSQPYTYGGEPDLTGLMGAMAAAIREQTPRIIHPAAAAEVAESTGRLLLAAWVEEYADDQIDAWTEHSGTTSLDAWLAMDRDSFGRFVMGRWSDDELATWAKRHIERQTRTRVRYRVWWAPAPFGYGLPWHAQRRVYQGRQRVRLGREPEVRHFKTWAEAMANAHARLAKEQR